MRTIVCIVLRKVQRYARYILSVIDDFEISACFPKDKERPSIASAFMCIFHEDDSQRLV